MRLDIRRVTVRAVPVYQCECGAHEAGSIVTLELSGIPDIASLSGLVHPRHMPVGWASYGREHVLCPECKS